MGKQTLKQYWFTLLVGAILVLVGILIIFSLHVPHVRALRAFGLAVLIAEGIMVTILKLFINVIEFIPGFDIDSHYALLLFYCDWGFCSPTPLGWSVAAPIVLLVVYGLNYTAVTLLQHWRQH